MRYRSVAKGDQLSSLAAYVEAMVEDQKYIWYIAGPNEGVRAKGQDVLLMSDPVDEWILELNPEHPFVKAADKLSGDNPKDPRLPGTSMSG